jgi:hypothetical protein
VTHRNSPIFEVGFDFGMRQQPIPSRAIQLFCSIGLNWRKRRKQIRSQLAQSLRKLSISS